MNTENTSAISFSNGLFPVKKLAEFKGFEAKEGEMLVRKIEKGTGKDSLGAVVEKVSSEEFVAMLENGAVFEAATNWINETVCELLKGKLEEGTIIYKHQYNLEAIVEFLNAQEIKEGRVSKEKIGAWFDANVSYKLKAAFTAKLGQVENDKMSEILKAYKVNFMSLAKRELSLPDAIRVNLGKALELIEDSGMKEYCTKKLADSAKVAIDLMEAL